MPYTFDIFIVVCMFIACAVAYIAGCYSRQTTVKTVRDLNRRLEWYRQNYNSIIAENTHLCTRHPMHKLRTVYEEVMQTDVPITPEQAKIIRSYASRLMQVQENAPPNFC